MPTNYNTMELNYLPRLQRACGEAFTEKSINNDNNFTLTRFSLRTY